MNYKFLLPIIVIISLLLMSFSTFSNHKIFDSLLKQQVLIYDFNNNLYSIPNLEENLNVLAPEYPNLIATGIPIRDLRARYYFHENDINNALKELDKKQANPYLGYNEYLKTNIYTRLSEVDSIKYYSEVAFYKIPANKNYSSLFFAIVEKLKDVKRLKSVTEEMVKVQNFNSQFIFLKTMNELLGFKSKLLSDAIYKYLEKSNEYTNYQKNDLISLSKVNYKNKTRSAELYTLYKNTQDRATKLSIITEAHELNPINWEYLYQKGINEYVLEKNNKSLKTFHQLYERSEKDNEIASSAYYLGLLYNRTENKNKACSYLEIATEKSPKTESWKKVHESLCSKNSK